MDHNLQKAFTDSSIPSFSDTLEKRIMYRIEQHKTQKSRVYQFGMKFISLFSLTGTVFLGIKTAGYLSTSGFFEYLSLISSENVSLLSYWKEIGGVIADSLPITGATTLLLLTGIFLWSIGSWYKPLRLTLQTV